MGVGGKDNLPAHGPPLPQKEQFRIGRVPVAPGHGAGVDLQQCPAGIRCVEGSQRRLFIAGMGLVKEAVPGVELGHKVDMPQDGGPPGGYAPHLLVVGLRHGQAIPVEGLLQAGRQMGLVPVNGVWAAAGDPQVVGTANPIVKSRRGHVGKVVQFNAQKDFHPSLVLCPQAQNRFPVGGHILGEGSALVLGKGGVAVAGEAEVPDACLEGGLRHSLRGVLPVAEGAVGVDGAGTGGEAHCIRSCLTL